MPTSFLTHCTSSVRSVPRCLLLDTVVRVERRRVKRGSQRKGRGRQGARLHKQRAQCATVFAFGHRGEV